MKGTIRLFRKTDGGWQIIAEYSDWASLYAENPGASEGLRLQHRYKVEMEPRESTKIQSRMPEPPTKEEIPETERVYIRRQWNDWRIGYASVNNISDPRWDMVSGGNRAPAPQPFIYAYVSCYDVRDEIGHSCLHGEGPHRIKVCVVKRDNSSRTYSLLLEGAGPKPISQKKRAERKRKRGISQRKHPVSARTR